MASNPSPSTQKYHARAVVFAHFPPNPTEATKYVPCAVGRTTKSNLAIRAWKEEQTVSHFHPPSKFSFTRRHGARPLRTTQLHNTIPTGDHSLTSRLKYFRPRSNIIFFGKVLLNQVMSTGIALHTTRPSSKESNKHWSNNLNARCCMV